jgi:hypothetical protein
LAPANSALLVLSDIEALVVRGWQRISEQGFRLRNPAITVPMLRAACASEESGWIKIGGILLAACDVVPGAVPPSMAEYFRKLVIS